MVDDKNTEGFDVCLFKKLLYPFDVSEYSIHIKILYDLPCLVFRKKPAFWPKCWICIIISFKSLYEENQVKLGL